MNVIHLYNELNQTTTVTVVSNKQLRYIQRLEYTGNFKRFGLSIYKDNVKKPQYKQNNIRVSFRRI